jgi:hypothetical protein
VEAALFLPRNEATMLKTFVCFVVCLFPLCAQNAEPSSRSVPGKSLWRASLVTLAAANALDVHSSWGKHELNGTLAGSDGRFGGQGALLKLGGQGGLLGIEYLFTRRHPTGKLYRALSFINFGAAALTTGVAVHNYTVPRPPR